MNFTRFFIDRPIVGIVLSIFILVAGLLSAGKLPLSEYPAVSPPTVTVRAVYPGANPKTIAETVAGPLEQEINGIDGMQYMNSYATSDGKLNLSVTFAQGTDVSRAETEVQNRVSRALPRLPVEVQRLGVTAQKVSPDMLMVVHLVSPSDRYDNLHLSNFAQLQVKDALARLDGIGDVVVWGAGDYSLRVWLDPDLLTARGLTASDVVKAIREQNAQAAAGLIGQPPDAGASFQISLNVSGRLASPAEFEEIVLKVGVRGEIVRLKDVARVELGSNQYALRSLIDNRPAAAIAVFQAPGASAIAASDAVRKTMASMQHGFPEGIEYRIAYDPTLFVRASIAAVSKTLVEALLLVVLVVVLFLQSWRASLIPLVAVPVSLVGTLAGMHWLGYSLNTLSLFGLVLSIGIVVDDAIVVVENVERHLRAGKRPREAAYAAMAEVTGPIIAITSVLSAVFIPTAFMGGLSGQFYQQFAITIAISTVLSAINSLTLSPALAALLVKPHAENRDVVSRFIDTGFGWIFRPFNRLFERSSIAYVGLTRKLIRRSALMLAIFAGLVSLTVAGLQRTPSGFVPAQDKYYLVGIVQLPGGASLDRTEEVVRRVSKIAMDHPGVETVVAFPGLSINGFVNSSSAAVFFAMLDPFEQRTTADLSAGAIAGGINAKLAPIEEAFVAIFPPPPVPGLGATGGFKLQIQDREGRGFQALSESLQAVMKQAAADPRLSRLFSAYQANVPQLRAEVDRQKAKSLGVELTSVFETLQIQLGSLYANDFNYLGRTYQVNVQADAKYRSDAESVARLWTRNAQGQLVPLSALVSLRPDAGPDPVTRYNGFSAADLSGAPGPGVSSGEAVAAMQEILERTLTDGFRFEWTELTFQQMQEGNSGLLVFPLAVLFAFLILAAQYNSWKLPIAVLMIAPMALLSALAGVWITGGDINLFTQIGFVVLVGLATKNAILIIEFARNRESQGADALDAVLDACRLRLRPILMTSLAFIMGVVPLALATGAGAEMRRAMGAAVLSGMVGVTIFGLLLTPVFYMLLRRRAAPQSLEVKNA